MILLFARSRLKGEKLSSRFWSTEILFFFIDGKKRRTRKCDSIWFPWLICLSVYSSGKSIKMINVDMCVRHCDRGCNSHRRKTATAGDRNVFELSHFRFLTNSKGEDLARWIFAWMPFSDETNRVICWMNLLKSIEFLAIKWCKVCDACFLLDPRRVCGAHDAML